MGLDASAGMLAALRRRRRELPAVRADAHRLPFREESFEVVAFVTTLEFLADPQRALAEAARVARSRLVVLWLNPTSLGALGRSRASGGLRSRSRKLGVRRVREMLRTAAGERAGDIQCASALFQGRSAGWSCRSRWEMS